MTRYQGMGYLPSALSNEGKSIYATLKHEIAFDSDSMSEPALMVGESERGLEIRMKMYQRAIVNPETMLGMNYGHHDESGKALYTKFMQLVAQRVPLGAEQDMNIEDYKNLLMHTLFDINGGTSFGEFTNAAASKLELGLAFEEKKEMVLPQINLGGQTYLPDFGWEPQEIHEGFEDLYNLQTGDYLQLLAFIPQMLTSTFSTNNSLWHSAYDTSYGLVEYLIEENPELEPLLTIPKTFNDASLALFEKREME